MPSVLYVSSLPGRTTAATEGRRAAIRRYDFTPNKRCIFWPGLVSCWRKLQPRAELEDFTSALNPDANSLRRMERAQSSPPTPAAAIDFLVTVGKLKVDVYFFSLSIKDFFYSDDIVLDLYKAVYALTRDVLKLFSMLWCRKRCAQAGCESTSRTQKASQVNKTVEQR